MFTIAVGADGVPGPEAETAVTVKLSAAPFAMPLIVHVKLDPVHP